MKKILGLMVLLGLAATPVLAQKVTIDYAHDFDFSKIKTFQYVETKESDSTDPLMAERITSMIKKELVEGGLAEVEENPDVFVTYHVTTQQSQVFHTTSFGYGGYWGGWGGWGYPRAGLSSSSTTATTYTEGTLIIDAWDPAEKKMIWRATGTVTVKAKPQKQVRQVEKILTKIGARWEKILRNMGK
jgi:hypothetical protein